MTTQYHIVAEASLSKRPRLLDLFCCEGGAGQGYADAGFEVVGVDIEPQPRYPFEFHQGDALEYLRRHGHEFDAIHASPPCQGYSRTNQLNDNEHPLMIEDVRALLIALGKPYAIENVPGAPLLNPLTLCGTMFGLNTIRHRLFETSPVCWFAPYLCNHRLPNAKMGRQPKPGCEYIQVVGHFANVEMGRAAMEMPWASQYGLAQAIPPAYTQFIGQHLMKHLTPA